MEFKTEKIRRGALKTIFRGAQSSDYYDELFDLIAR